MLKPFDLQKASAGDPVVTRDGDPVTQLVHFEGILHGPCSVRGVIKGAIQAFDAEGRFSGLQYGSKLDLFMAPKVRTVFVNVFCTQGATKLSTMAAAFDTIAEAEAHAERLKGHNMSIVKLAHPIQVED